MTRSQLLFAIAMLAGSHASFAAAPTSHTATTSPAPATAAAVSAEDDSVVRVRGRVLDPAGRPVGGAAVTVPSSHTWETRLTRKPVARATSGDDGRFHITFRDSDVRPADGRSRGGDGSRFTQIVASRDGFGIGFASTDETDAAGDVVLQLVKHDVPIDARVLDLEGQPVEASASSSATSARS